MKWSTAARRPGARAAAGLAVLAAAAALACPAPALAATVPFGLTPVPGAGGQPRSYFTMSISPGRSGRDAVLISNPAAGPARLRVTVSRGVTAANSGSAFEPMTGGCRGAGCWIRGLPGVITLGPGARRVLPFQVTVPPGTGPGQYLAGITAELAARPRPSRLGAAGRTGARAIVVDQVIVGVAVTVGRVAALRTALAIAGVSGSWVGPVPRLNIAVRNTGQKFARAGGRVTCQSGGREHSYPVIMETVLPGGRAVLPVNARGLASGSLACTVALRLGPGLTARWSGTVNLPPLIRTRTYHPSRGVFVSLPVSSMPPWALALLILMTLILITLAVMIVMRHRAARPRSRPVRRTASHGRAPGRRAAGIPAPPRRRGQAGHSAASRP